MSDRRGACSAAVGEAKESSYSVLCPLFLGHSDFSSFDDLATRTRKEIKGVISAGALGARPGALGRPRCRHGEPLGARLELRLRNLS